MRTAEDNVYFEEGATTEKFANYIQQTLTFIESSMMITNSSNIFPHTLQDSCQNRDVSSLSIRRQGNLNIACWLQQRMLMYHHQHTFTLHNNNHSSATSAVTTPTISPHPHILFIKTHKTGSSTITGILWRSFCQHNNQHHHQNQSTPHPHHAHDKHNSTVTVSSTRCFLPPHDHPGRIWDFVNRPQHRQYVNSFFLKNDENVQSPTFTVKKSNHHQETMMNVRKVWLHHVKVSDFLYREVIPAVSVSPKSPSHIVGGRIEISIVRRPALRLQSAWYWYGLMNETNDALVRMTKEKNRNDEPFGHKPIQSFEDFASRLVGMHDESGSKNESQGDAWLQSIPWRYRTGPNSMSEELTGVSLTASVPNGRGDSREVSEQFRHRFIELVHKVKNMEIFLLICDRFDESLVLLKKLLHDSDTVADVDAESERTWLYLRQKVQRYQKIQDLHHPEGSVTTATSSSSSDALLTALDRYQVYDYILFRLANQVMDYLIEHIYGKEVFQRDLVAYREELQVLQKHCSSFVTSMKQKEKECELFQNDNRQIVQKAHQQTKT
jgi:hypothetical protein